MRGRYVDLATGVGVGVWLLPVDAWLSALGGLMSVRADAIGAGEVMIVGVRATS
jgi:hypothetical protein